MENKSNYVYKAYVVFQGNQEIYPTLENLAIVLKKTGINYTINLNESDVRLVLNFNLDPVCGGTK